MRTEIDEINNKLYEIITGESHEGLISCNKEADFLSVNLSLVSEKRKKKEQIKNILNSLNNIKKLDKKDRLVKDKECCCICMETFTKKNIRRELKCGHNFHKSCIDKWFLKSETLRCPICRTKCV